MNIQIYNFESIKPIIVQSSQSGKRLDHILCEYLPLYSRSQIKRWILDKQVILNNQISIYPKKKIITGTVIEFKNIKYQRPYSSIIVPQNIYLHVIYEDDDILVINKPSNMLVYPGVKHYTNTVLNALLYKYPNSIAISEHAGIVHRLDKDTTGLMIIAKNHIAYNNLLQSFKTREVMKKYEAIVVGNFFYNTGTIDKPIRRHALKRTCMTVHAMGKSAVTHYSVIEKFSMHTRLHVYLETGRTHQIRVHMAYINHPLIGDRKYGKSNFCITGISNQLNDYLNCFNRQALHACTLQLLHPITHIKMTWHIPLPQDMIDLIDMLKNN